MVRRDDHRICKFVADDAKRQLTVCGIKIRSRTKLNKVEILIDRRRKLPFVTRAAGNRFQVIFLTDDARLARRAAYDLAGW